MNTYTNKQGWMKERNVGEGRGEEEERKHEDGRRELPGP